MSEKKIIWIAIVIAVVVLSFYVINFIGFGLSDNTADWGSFGNYAAIALSVLSIALIFATYREQRSTNEITRVEQHIVTMSNTLIALTEKNRSKLETIYTSFCKHFIVPFGDLSDCEHSKVVKVCNYYYSTSTIMLSDNDTENLNSLFKYMHLCFDFVIHDKALSKENKQLRITELSCLLPESLRTMFFCWSLLFNSGGLKEYHKSGLFNLDYTSSSLLKDVIDFVCTEKRKEPIKTLGAGEIILDDHPDEQFFDTYSRINDEEKKYETGI